LALKREKAESPGAFEWRRWLSFDSVIRVMNSIGTAWVFVLLVIINLDIGGRAIFNSPLRGVPEIVAMSIVACVFLQIAHTLKVGRLTRSEILLNLLQARFPKLRQFCEGLYHLVGACLLAVLFSASIPLFSRAWEIGEYVGAEGDFMAPIWPVKMIILIGCVAGSLQFLIMAVRNFRRMLLSGKSGGDDGRGLP
jgi:TRAP-type mannitol/chloroaromatic compound transport system permease small subunit